MRSFLLVFALFCFFVSSAQNQSSVIKDNAYGFDEASLREKMKNDGLPGPVIDKLIAQRKELFENGKNVQSMQLKKLPVANAICSDMSVENGWASWLGDLGTASTGTVSWTPPPVLPATPNFSITSGSGIDGNTPGPTLGDPTIPVVCPSFGNKSILLGETCVAGCVAEQLTYPLTVTAQDTTFLVAYAIVFQDAGHAPADAPYVDFCIYDPSGNPITIAGSCFRFTAAPAIPGFYPVSGTGCGFSTTDYYKPWTVVPMNLSAYIGQNLSVVITNVDCAQCGHWSYSYWDFSCGSSSMFLNTTTTPDSCSAGDGTATVNITGGSPPYTFLWSNGQTTQTATGLATGNYTVTVTDSTSLSVSTVVTVPNSLTAAIPTVTNVSCFGGNDGSVTVTVTSGIPPFTYLWSDGQSAATAVGLVAISYSVLITDAIGCSATLTVQVTGPSALNLSTSYSPASCWNCYDGTAISNVTGGTPPYTYLWITSPVQTSPNAGGVPPGSYQLIVTDSNGCSSSNTAYVLFLGVNEILCQAVIISPNPSSGNFVIDFGGKNFGKTEISLYSLVGEKVLEVKAKANGKQEFDASVAPAGIYFLKLNTEQGTTTKKVIITK